MADFAMPGDGIRDFSRHAARIARAGVYDPVIHYEQIIKSLVVDRWKVGDLTKLDEPA